MNFQDTLSKYRDIFMNKGDSWHEILNVSYAFIHEMCGHGLNNTNINSKIYKQIIETMTSRVDTKDESVRSAIEMYLTYFISNVVAISGEHVDKTNKKSDGIVIDPSEIPDKEIDTDFLKLFDMQHGGDNEQ